MSTALDAIYENGLLRPLTPLRLPEHTRVHLSLETVASDPGVGKSVSSEARAADFLAWAARPRPQAGLGEAGRDVLYED